MQRICSEHRTQSLTGIEKEQQIQRTKLMKYHATCFLYQPLKYRVYYLLSILIAIKEMLSYSKGEDQ